MTRGKRLLDLGVLIAISPIILPLAGLIALAILLVDGRPVFFSQIRVKEGCVPFRFWKFRTMRVDPNDHGISGGHKAARVTRLGAILRRGHLDEIPQGWNVLRGDVSLVGPRAPLPDIVARHPKIYQNVLQSRPGLTGLASFFYSKHEAWLLAGSETAEEAQALYERNCVPRKARLDLIYQRHASIWFDLWLFGITTCRILHLPLGRKPKGRYADAAEGGGKIF